MNNFRRALLRWLAREPAGFEALLTDDEVYAADTAALEAFKRRLSLDPADIGRGGLSKSSIVEVVSWLERVGWRGEDAGRLQVYAAWLIKRREAYESGQIGVRES